MDVAGKLKGLCETYFHWEPANTYIDKALNGLKLVSYILVVLPIIAGIALGVTTLILKNRKIVPVNVDQDDRARAIDDLAQDAISSSDDSDSDDDDDSLDGQGGQNYFNHPALKDVLRDKILPDLVQKDLNSLSETCKSLAKKTEQERDKRWAAIRDAMIFGEDKWKALGVDLDDVLELPEDIDEILKGPCPFHKGKRVFQTHRLVLIPSNVSINQLGILMKHLRNGDHPNVYEFILPEIVQQMGDDVVAKSYWALITCDEIPRSRKKTFADQMKLFEEYPEYEHASVFEAIALVTMNRECRNEFLLSRNPLTFTRCKPEEVIQGNPLVVGSFSPSGLEVRSVSGYPGCCNWGIIGVRKFT